MCLGVAAAAGCTDDPEVGVTNQEIGSQPSCPPDHPLLNWQVPTGPCNSCSIAGISGQLATEYAECRGMPGTLKLINTHACALGCNGAELP